MLLAMKDEAGSNLNNEENDCMLDTSYGEETMEELIDAVILTARNQPVDGNAETVPSYDAKVVSEVNASSKLLYRLTSMFVVLVMRGEKRVLDLSPSKSSNSSWPLGWSLRSVGLPHGIRGLVEEGGKVYPWGRYGCRVKGRR
ncbi:hypothetical protein Tco_0222904 [Tanacetum coccineum]